MYGGYNMGGAGDGGYRYPGPSYSNFGYGQATDALPEYTSVGADLYGNMNRAMPPSNMAPAPGAFAPPYGSFAVPGPYGNQGAPYGAPCGFGGPNSGVYQAPPVQATFTGFQGRAAVAHAPPGTVPRPPPPPPQYYQSRKKGCC
mmetsp:Transcript_65780/g.157197  ORF Transcript_65780/g.157197 Transcript_65780/m.157197 type:complete len:144 (-) Transcript_65780:51-482(-)